MVVIKPDSVIRCCDDCGDEKLFRRTQRLVERLAAQQTHRCRSCHARAVARHGGIANAAKHDRQHFEALGQRLAAFNAAHPENARKGGQAAAALGIPSLAGKIGGKRNAAKGNLQRAGMAAHTPAAEQKRHETKKRSGKLASSAGELRCLEVLREAFGPVEHHVLIDGKFHVDFFVHDVDTYVQFDGEHWHGLKRPYEELDARQRRKYDIDRALDEHMVQTNRRLVRITDAQFASWTTDDVIKHVRCEDESVGSASS